MLPRKQSRIDLASNLIATIPRLASSGATSTIDCQRSFRGKHIINPLHRIHNYRFAGHLRCQRRSPYLSACHWKPNSRCKIGNFGWLADQKCGRFDPQKANKTLHAIIETTWFRRDRRLRRSDRLRPAENRQPEGPRSWRPRSACARFRALLQ